MLFRGGCQNNDRHQTTRDNHEAAESLYSWLPRVAKYDDHAADYVDESRRKEDMPILYDEFWMKESPHLDDNLAADVAKRRNATHIGKEVEVAGEEAKWSSPSPSGSYGRVMVHCEIRLAIRHNMNGMNIWRTSACGRDRAGELSQ